MSVVGAGVIWVALLGPVIVLFDHISGSAIASALTQPGALQPVATSLESGLVTLGVTSPDSSEVATGWSAPGCVRDRKSVV